LRSSSFGFASRNHQRVLSGSWCRRLLAELHRRADVAQQHVIPKRALTKMATTGKERTPPFSSETLNVLK
jgi:hypothetical protein